ncbi:hypothetical protein [Flavobacterium algicola]|uniref:hypothetical protein n=1 Tax=Flavobacterium algicola TaxID=556529 RepID=UPI001EFE5DD8|nr:hypothetical protein [Flavobacterium algicola]MCG9793241.1 hypothetical protein [Flavobacterium algicola]
MKKALILSALAIVMSFGTLAAKEVKPKKNSSSIKQEITQLLRPSFLVDELKNDVVVLVKVLITPKNEIVVLKTNSSSAVLDAYIKDSLNYKKVNSTDVVSGDDYEFEVKFKS